MRVVWLSLRCATLASVVGNTIGVGAFDPQALQTQMLQTLETPETFKTLKTLKTPETLKTPKTLEAPPSTCATCCTPGGSCAHAWHGVPGVCCSTGSTDGSAVPQCCPLNASCMLCNSIYRCASSPQARCPDAQFADAPFWLVWSLVGCIVCGAVHFLCGPSAPTTYRRASVPVVEGTPVASPLHGSYMGHMGSTHTASSDVATGMLAGMVLSEVVEVVADELVADEVVVDEVVVDEVVEVIADVEEDPPSYNETMAAVYNVGFEADV